MRRRSRLKIIIDILEVVESEGSARITKILYGANMAYDRLVKYLEELERSGLIEVRKRDGVNFYQLTDKGRRLLHEYRRVERLARAFGIEI